MPIKLFVGNLSYATTSQDLNELFSAVGSISSCRILEDKDSGRSRGFGFVVMSSKAESENAIAQLNGLEFAGRPLIVRQAHSMSTDLKCSEPSQQSRGRGTDLLPARAYFKVPVDIFGW